MTIQKKTLFQFEMDVHDNSFKIRMVHTNLRIFTLNYTDSPKFKNIAYEFKVIITLSKRFV